MAGLGSFVVPRRCTGGFGPVSASPSAGQDAGDSAGRRPASRLRGTQPELLLSHRFGLWSPLSAVDSSGILCAGPLRVGRCRVCMEPTANLRAGATHVGTDTEEKRDEFLIQWYGILWANVTRSMEGIWKVLAPIAVVGTVMAAVQKGYLPLPLGSSLTFVILLWALNMTIDLNQWHRRNLVFLTAVEREFLRDDDYGRVIPAKYRERGAEWIRFYMINAVVFGVLLVLAAGYAALADGQRAGAWYHWLVLGVGLLLTAANLWDTESRARAYARELSGRPRDGASSRPPASSRNTEMPAD